MRREDLEQVLADQRKELLVCDRSRLVGRVEEAQIHLDSALAQVVIGVRRSGKSTLCQAAVLQSGRPFGYVNFDDERLASLRGEDLNTVLETLYALNGDFDVLFLDEVQNIPEWNLFVNRLLRQGMHVLVTGSNAKLLSSELATHMVGRYDAVELFPLSFAEFCAFRGVDPTDKTTLAAGLRQRALDDYLRQGGFPELLTGDLSAPKYVSTLVSDILERDIRQRLRQRSVRPIRAVADYLLNVVPAVLNPSWIAPQTPSRPTSTICAALICLSPSRSGLAKSTCASATRNFTPWTSRSWAVVARPAPARTWVGGWKPSSSSSCFAAITTSKMRSSTIRRIVPRPTLSCAVAMRPLPSFKSLRTSPHPRSANANSAGPQPPPRPPVALRPRSLPSTKQGKMSSTASASASSVRATGSVPRRFEAYCVQSSSVCLCASRCFALWPNPTESLALRVKSCNCLGHVWSCAGKRSVIPAWDNGGNSNGGWKVTPERRRQ